MKNGIIRLSSLLVFFVLTIVSCTKLDQPLKEPDNMLQNVAGRVNDWLDKQKLKYGGAQTSSGRVRTNSIDGTKKSNKLVNIELLQQSLDFDEAIVEVRENSRNYLIIPIGESLVSEKKLDKSATLFLMLLTDKQGNIKTGKIVYYTPDDVEKQKKLALNTFANMFNNRPISNNGKFRFMDITGGWEYQREYKYGQLYSFGYITNKKSSGISPNKISTEDGCTDWFLVTTIYYSNGMTETYSEYVGTTCDPCDSGDYLSLCFPGGGGGSSSTPKTRIEESYEDDSSPEYDNEWEGDDLDQAITPDGESLTTAGKSFEAITCRHFIEFARDEDTREIDWVIQSSTKWEPVYSNIFWSSGNISKRYLVGPVGELKNYIISGTALTAWWSSSAYGFFTNNWNSNSRTETYHDNKTLNWY